MGMTPEKARAIQRTVTQVVAQIDTPLEFAEGRPDPVATTQAHIEQWLHYAVAIQPGMEPKDVKRLARRLRPKT